MQDMTEKTDCPAVGTFCPKRLAALDNNDVASQLPSPTTVYNAATCAVSLVTASLGHQRITG